MTEEQIKAEEKIKEYWSIFEEVQKHSKPSMETLKRFEEIHDAMNEMRESINDISSKLNSIFPFVQESMTEREFHAMLWKKIKEGGGALKWVVSIIIAVLLLSGYAKTAIISWLSFK